MLLSHRAANGLAACLKYDRGLAAGSERKKTNRASGTLRIRVSDAMLMLAARDGQVLAAQNSRTGALAAQTDALAARLGRMP